MSVKPTIIQNHKHTQTLAVRKQVIIGSEKLSTTVKALE